MNATPSFPQRHPRALRRWRAFPVIGAHLDGFVQWLSDRGYASSSISQYLRPLLLVVRWWRRRGIESFKQLTLPMISEAHRHFRSRDHHVSSAVRCLRTFFEERKTIPQGYTPPPTHLEVECARFAQYLRDECGLSEATILM